LIDNECFSNYFGIALYYCNNNNITGNHVYNNNAWGIFLYNCKNNNISGNTANYNGDFVGIYIWKCDNNVITENIANNNEQHGIKVYISTYNNINGNIANNNTWDGLFLMASDNNDLSGNIANYNGRNGLCLHSSDYNQILENTAYKNEYGIYLERAINNTISGNFLIGNDVCIFEIDCEGNVITGNVCEQPTVPGFVPLLLIGVLAIITAIIIRLQYRKRDNGLDNWLLE
jgi:parallel beta-helix repeat protein